MIPSRSLFGLFAVAIALTTTLPASAGDRDPGAAQQLFEDAQALLEKEEWEPACAKFKASWDLDPSVGTLLNIAKCDQHFGKLAAALSRLEEALRLNRTTPDEARRESVEGYARERIAALKPRVPQLTIEIAERPPGLRVTRNGTEIPLSALGQSLPVDPGTVEVVAEAPGFRGSRTVSLGEAAKLIVELTLEPVATDPVVVAPTVEDQDAVVWPWIVGGTGLALGVVAVVFGVDYVNTVDELEEICHGDLEQCRPDDPTFDAADHNARKDRDMALTIAFGVAGGLALGAGIIGAAVELSGDDEQDDAPAASWQLVPWATPAAAGLAAGGQF